MTELPLYQIDAFAAGLFSGNPAAVCPLPGDWLPDATMQAVAAENNLAETAFLRAGDGGFDIRWFTPKLEVDLCGHATLASAYVVHKHLDPGCSRVLFQSASGPLTVACGGDCFTLDFPARPGRPLADDSVLQTVTEALGVAPEAVFMAPQMLAVLASAAEVRGCGRSSTASWRCRPAASSSPVRGRATGTSSRATSRRGAASPKIR